VKYRTTPLFERDYKKLSTSDKAKFQKALKVFIETCKVLEYDPVAHSWPGSLRFEKLKGAQGVCAITWSFSGPDGRATFHFETEHHETVVIGRRVCLHTIYKNP
jgi:hypothetical protein